MDRGAERRVKRGQVSLAGVLDLHGYTQAQAHAALVGFLRGLQAPAPCAALVVTGKGERLTGHETTLGVLRQRLPQWLAEPALRDVVSGFSSAHRRHGGTGAYYVFLRRRSD